MTFSLNLQCPLNTEQKFLKPENTLVSVRFYLKPPTTPSFCQILPWNPLVSLKVYIRSSQVDYPLSVTFYLKCPRSIRFTSEDHRFCHILPQNPQISVKFYLRISQFLSDCTSEPIPYVRFYLRTPYFLSDFTSESPGLSVFASECPSFCQILPQKALVPVRFYLRIFWFLSDLISESWVLSDFTSEASRFSQIFT